jgi:D-erythro-7,8-dihydroneopterin triphosphate epimerase
MNQSLQKINDLSSIDNHYSDGFVVAEAMIRISNLRLRTFIGFNEEELAKQQDVVINSNIYYQADSASHSDNEDDALNYKTITKAMIRHVEQGQFRLLEKLCHDLLAIIMQQSLVLRADITIDKPHALRFADSVAVSLSASRAE